MTNRITHLFLVLMLGVTSLVAQEDTKPKDTWIAPNITDEMTVSPEQNANWKSGDYGYSAKPKNALELGIHAGHFHINGDVPNDPWAGFGVGLHLRKAINYVFSWRIGGMYSSASGLDGRLTTRDVLRKDNKAEDGSRLFKNFDDDNFTTYRTFKTTNFQGSAELLVNIGNLLFHEPRNKWNFYAGIGLGVNFADTNMNYFNGDSETLYDWSAIEAEYPKNTRAKRKAIKAELDDSYETAENNNRNVLGGLYDDGSVFPSFTGSLGISRKLSKRVNLTLEHQAWFQDYDKLDGHFNRTTVDQSNDSDVVHYTNVRLGINLGSFNKVTEPLYWLNPLDATFNDIAELKKRPILDLTDADADGVLDFLDQEINTAAGCPVDTRGVTLDSDGDGLADCKDQEIYSPPGYEIDDNGVAIVPVPDYINEAGVNTIVDEKIAGLRSTLVRSGCGEWFLPMIHFDLDKYYIKPDFYGELHHIAEVMRICPELCVTVQGHTDSRNTNDYNTVLSYNRAKAAVDYLVANYGIPRSRFTLMYGGETQPLIKNVPERGGSEVRSQQYMNRRVEFRVCQPGDAEMGQPSGPNAGSGYQSGGSKGVYGGNKSSGY